jgi:hypothetical protein
MNPRFHPCPHVVGTIRIENYETHARVADNPHPVAATSQDGGVLTPRWQIHQAWVIKFFFFFPYI